MRPLLLPLLALVAPLTTAQQLIASSLPSCAQQCTVLQQAQTGCTPAGGAPVSNSGIYQSCFCQSALLPQLYSGSPVQLCSTCSAADMATIQNWYKNLCGKGGAPAPGANNQQPAATPSTTSSTTTFSTINPATAGATSTQQDNNISTDTSTNGPWMSTHWKWVLMLLVILLGLGALTILFYFLHRRYHNKRESQWSTASRAQPDINTWGPGQSVHDLGFTGGGKEGGFGAGVGGLGEKGKTRDMRMTQEVVPPSPVWTGREGRGSGKFF